MSNGETVVWWIHTALTTWWLFLCFTQGRERRARFLLMLYTSVVYVALAVWCRVFPGFSAYHLLWLDPVCFYVTPILTVRRISFKEFRLRYAPPVLPSLLLIVGILIFAVSKFPWWVVVGGLLLIFIGVSWHSGSERNKRLEEWASSIPMSPNVRQAMDDLMLAAKAALAANGQPPLECPLERLTTDERQYLQKICSPAFLPEEFGRGTTVAMWASELRDLKAKGLTDEQARIVIGMVHNGFFNLERLDTRKATRKSSNLKIPMCVVFGGCFFIS